MNSESEPSLLSDDLADIQHDFKEIDNPVYWVKIVEMLQQNWALVDDREQYSIVYFLNDFNEIFDCLRFTNHDEASESLRINGFSIYEEDESLKRFLSCPTGDFSFRPHWNGRIYSIGKFWK